MIELFTLWLPLFFDPLAAIVLIATTLQHNTFRVAPVWHRLGLLVTACGLLGQAYRNFISIFGGNNLIDVDMPFWVLKDYGIAILAGHILYLLLRGKRYGR